MDFFPSLSEISLPLAARNLGISFAIVAWLYLIGIRRRDLALMALGVAIAVNVAGCPVDS